MTPLWLLLIVFGVGLLEGQEEEGCHPYYLDNECREVVTWTEFGEEQQIARFNQIDLLVSDIRMTPPRCRRPTIHLICSATFGVDCINSSSIFPPPKVLEIVCEQLVEDCGLPIQNCSSFFSVFFPGSEESPPGDEISYVFPDTFDPIPVTTCTDGEEDITCCFDPYGFGSDRECVVACAPPFFSDDKDRTFLIQMYVYLGVSTIVVVFSLIPLLATPDALKFPKYCLPLSIVFYVISLHMHAWGLYVYPENFLCDGHDSYFEAYADLIDSATCIMQSILFYFFFILSQYWMVVMSMGLAQLSYAQSQRPDPLTTFFNDLFKFKYAEPIFHLIGILIASFAGIGGTFIARADDLLSLDGPWQACSINPQGSAGLIPYIVAAILLGLSVIFIVFFTFSLVRRSLVFVRIHFRIFAFLVLMCIQFFSFLIFVLIFIGQYAYLDRLRDLMVCVSSQPRIEDSGCSLGKTHFYAVFSWVYGTLYLIMFFICLVVYMSNPLLYSWWKSLIWDRKIVNMKSSSLGKSSDSLGKFPEMSQQA